MELHAGDEVILKSITTHSYSRYNRLGIPREIGGFRAKVIKKRGGSTWEFQIYWKNELPFDEDGRPLTIWRTEDNVERIVG